MTAQREESLTSPPTKERQIKASVLHGAKDLRIETRTLASPGLDELQVSVRTTGLCGSDLHYYRHYRNGDIIVREPMSLGHESAGVVVGVGSNVSNFEVGDKVALEVGLPCGECERCREGRYNICKGMQFRSSAKAFPHAQGTLQDRINHPAKWCHKLPPSLPLPLGALLEPLSVAIHATRRAQLPPKSTVLVFGAGAVGLLVAAMAKLTGAATVVIADIDAGRVDFAVRHGFAHRAFVVPLRPRDEPVVEALEGAREVAAEIGKVRRYSSGGGVSNGTANGKTEEEAIGEVDAVFECTGVQACLQTAIYATRPGGRVMLIGMGTPVQTLPISAAALREVDLVGVFRYADTYPEGIEVLSRTGPDVPEFAKLVTHRYTGLEGAEKAFEMAARTKDDEGNLVIKVMIEMNNGDN